MASAWRSLEENISDEENGLQEVLVDPTPEIKYPFDKMNDLEKEVEELKGAYRSLIGDYNRQMVHSSYKSLLKPRDIPVLELTHLQGVEGEGRLKVFFSQVEECSLDERERQKIVMTRVDNKLAVYIQSIWEKQGVLSWKNFKQHLVQELTDPSYNKILDSLNDLRYHYTEDPVNFVSQLKCKLALLEVKSGEEDTPNIRKLIKTKIAKGLPKDCRERLELFITGLFVQNT